MNEPNVQDREKILQQKTTTINIRISPVIKTEFMNLAAINGITLSEMVENALSEFLKSDEEKKKCFVMNEQLKKQHDEDTNRLAFFLNNPIIKQFLEKSHGNIVDYLTREGIKKKAHINSIYDVYKVYFEIINFNE